MKPVPRPHHRIVRMSGHIWWWERESWKHEYRAALLAEDIHRLSLSLMAARAFDKLKGKQ